MYSTLVLHQTCCIPSDPAMDKPDACPTIGSDVIAGRDVFRMFGGSTLLSYVSILYKKSYEQPIDRDNGKC